MSRIDQVVFAAIDFESAGVVRGQTDHPVQIGMARWSLEVGPTAEFVSYLQCAEPILWSAQKVHGIASADLVDAPALLALWPEIKSRLSGAIVVAHGKGTEKRFLRAFPGHGFGPWLDTLVLARAVWPAAPDHSLSALCEQCALTEEIQSWAPQRKWHDALFDAVASLALLRCIIRQLHLEQQPIDLLLQPSNQEWHLQRRS